MRLIHLLAALAVASPFSAASAATVKVKFCPRDNAVPNAMAYAYNENDTVQIASASQSVVDAGRVAYLTCATEKCAFVFRVPSSTRSFSTGMGTLQGGAVLETYKALAKASDTVCLYATYNGTTGNFEAVWTNKEPGCHCNVH